jgi:hypothetical protein
MIYPFSHPSIQEYKNTKSIIYAIFEQRGTGFWALKFLLYDYIIINSINDRIYKRKHLRELKCT